MLHGLSRAVAKRSVKKSTRTLPSEP
jgi:hypothetical protein